MEIKKTVSVEFTENDLKEIVAEYVSKKMSKSIKPEEVSFQIGHRYDGYDDRFAVEYVKGCSVTYHDN